MSGKRKRDREIVLPSGTNGRSNLVKSLETKHNLIREIVNLDAFN